MLWICVISTCDVVCIRRIGCDEEFVDKVDVDQLTLVSLRIRKGTCLELSASYRYWSTSVSLKKRYLKIPCVLFCRTINFVRISFSG
jgi:hypothetical protein